MTKDTPLGLCPICGRDMDAWGKMHICKSQLIRPEEMPKRAVKKLPPMQHPAEEPIAGAKPSAAELQAKVDTVPAKRGRPRTKTPEERAFAARERMRKRREK